MEIDIYQQCPCHSEKKIKFCCGKEVVQELNQAISKNKAGQSLAALKLLKNTIDKLGPRDCLLTIQTHILISQGEIEQARESNDLFLSKNPGHSMGLQHRALIQAAEGDARGAVESLQDAMESLAGNRIPISLANVFRMLGMALFSEGQPLAARAHLQYAQSLKGETDEELQRLIFETFRLPGVSILLKNDFRLEPTPDDEPWGKSYSNVRRALDRGQFRRAVRILEKIDDQYPPSPIVRRGIAILHGFLGYIEQASPAWRRYSRTPGVEQRDAVEAEALAQLFQQDPITDEYDVVRATFEIETLDRILELAAESERLVVTPDIDQDPFGEGPPPRSGYYFLDHPKIDDAEQLTSENAPAVVAEVLLYGKETDRSARLEWVSTKNSGYESRLADLQSGLEDLIHGTGEEHVLGRVPAVSDVLNWEWQLPSGVTREQHQTLVNEKRKQALLEKWANLPFSVLDGKSPREAATSEDLLVPLQALLLHLEQSVDSPISGDSAISALRGELGVPAAAVLDPTSLPAGKEAVNLSPVQQQQLDCTKLTDDELIQIQSQAMAVGNILAMKNIVPEILERPQLEDRIPRDVSLSVMSQLVDDVEAGLDYLQQARVAAKKANRPAGVYLVQEFEYRLSRGMTDKLPELMQHLQLHHMGEPNVEYQLMRVLQKYGLIGVDGRMGPVPDSAVAGEPVQPAPAEPESGIWTPESASAEAKPSESKLWLPDSD